MQKFNPRAIDYLIDKHPLLNSKKDLSTFLGTDNNGKPLIKYDGIISWYRSKNPNTPNEKVIVALCEKFDVERSFFMATTL